MPVKKYVRKKRFCLVDGSVNLGYDETDRPPANFTVTNFDIFSLIYSIIVHILDVGFDINLAIHYYKEGHYTYFILTMVFMFVPALLVTLLSLRMYVADGDKVSVSRNAVQRKFICVLVLLLQLAPVMRYCDSLNYALRCRRAQKQGDRRKQEQFYRLMLNEDSDVALLRVFECYLESAPQQILQVSLLLLFHSQGSITLHGIQQALSIGSSFLSMAWCMASYHRSVRFDQDNKNNISWAGTFVQFLWHFNVTVSRILAISVIASFYPAWTGFAVGTHWFLMTVWVSHIDSTSFCGSSPFFELFFAGSVGLVYIFNFISVHDGPTRWQYLIYYPICLLENIAAVSVWALLAEQTIRDSWFYIPLTVIPVAAFLMGMGFLVLYYLAFHPSKIIPACSQVNVRDCDTDIVVKEETEPITVIENCDI